MTDIVERIYGAVDDEAMFASLPDMLSAVVGGRSTMLQHFDFAMRPLGFNFNYWTQDVLDDYVAEGQYLNDPWMPLVMNGTVPRNTVAAMNGFVPLEKVVAGAWYDFHRRHGDDTAHLVGGLIDLPDGMMTIGVQHGYGATGFTNEDAVKLDALVPHLARLYRLRGKLRGKSVGSGFAGDMLDAMADAIILVDARCRILLMNESAREMLAQRDGLSVRMGQGVELLAGQKRLERAVATAVHGREAMGDCFEMSRPSGLPPHRITVTPRQVGGDLRAMILIEAGSDGAALPWALAARLYGFTPAETRVLKGLLQGLSPEDIAEQRSVALSTIRSQVKQLLRKSGTNRISGLLATVASLPRLR